MRAYDFHELERRWRAAWERSHCHQAPEAPVGPKYFIHDAAPFPNGPLHLGHVRTYLLGDVMARYQRLRGRCVLYLTGFDAFGLPIELAAEEAGLSPPQLVAQCIGLMTRQLKELGISYDWSRVPRTCDPDCYRWTQWLFLELLEAGLIERRTARLHWCPRCRTTLARIQVEDEGCWRCGSRVTQRAFPQWFVAISHYSDRLHRTIENLGQWSNRSKRMLRGFIDTNGRADRSHGNRAHEWLVSRQRSWGTPIPIVYCACCGVVPVPREDLPVCLPETLDWTNGSGALARCESFRETSCPRCGGSARRETDTLDCFFDDIWCFLQPLVILGRSPGFTCENLGDWLPVDCAQSGLDTCICFHLYRFLGRFLHDRGLLHDPEPIRRFVGNEMVLAGGRKMSKHFGNAVSPESIVREHGADALRVAMLWSAGPQRAISWQPAMIKKAAWFLDRTYRLFARWAEGRQRLTEGRRSDWPSRAADSLQIATARSMARVTQFVEEYRPNAAIEHLDQFGRRVEEFARNRLLNGRLSSTDAHILGQVLRDYSLALAPFAPHLAEECWQLVGGRGLACRATWPCPRNVLDANCV